MVYSSSYGFNTHHVNSSYMQLRISEVTIIHNKTTYLWAHSHRVVSTAGIEVKCSEDYGQSRHHNQC